MAENNKIFLSYFYIKQSIIHLGLLIDMYCALIAYIIFEGPAEDRNMNTLVDMISGMEVKEDNENFMNAVDYSCMLYLISI